MDVVMPGMTGTQVLLRLVSSHPHAIGVNVVTGCPSAETRQEFLDSATENGLALDYMTKSFETGEVLKKVQRPLEQFHARRLEMGQGRD